MSREREREFVSGHISRWPRPDYGFIDMIHEGQKRTVFVHAQHLCTHLADLRPHTDRLKVELVHFYVMEVEKGLTSTRCICAQCHAMTLQKRRQRAALIEARHLLHGQRFDLGGGLPAQCFRKELVSSYPAFAAAERAAAGRVLARASQEEVIRAAADEMRRVLNERKL